MTHVVGAALIRKGGEKLSGPSDYLDLDRDLLLTNDSYRGLTHRSRTIRLEGRGIGSMKQINNTR
jgi:hypothetical protein